MDSRENGVSVATCFEDKSVLVTGVTGFLGKMILWKLLRDVPSCNTIHVLLRSRKTESAEDRLAEILRSEPFATMAPGIDLQRLRIVEGDVRVSDISSPILTVGADRDMKFDVIIHSGGLVQWDAPFEELFETNALGSLALMKHHLNGTGTLVFVSSSFVNGIGPTVSKDVVHEGPVPVTHVDFDSLYRDAKAMEGSRQARGLSWVAVARKHGWWDPYTLSKAAAEDMLARHARESGAKLAIVRPSGLVGAVEEPTRGWNDAFSGTVPFIVGLSSRQMKVLPGTPDAKIDWFPADLAVNAIIVAAARGCSHSNPSYFHIVSHDCNPVLLKEALAAWSGILVSRGFGPIPPVDWKASAEDFENEVNEQMKWIRRAHSMLSSFPLVPSAVSSRLGSAVRAVDKLIGLGRLYAPYMMSEWRFDSSNTRRLMTEMLSEQDKHIFSYDTSFKWEDLWADHVDAMFRYAVNVRKPNAKL